MQAADTDISALVEIEKNSPHRFEFFMGLVGDQSICARTAWAYGKAGGRISHALSVYSCQLRQPNQVLDIHGTFSYLFSACILLFCDKKNEGLLIISWTGKEDLSVPQE